MLAQVLEAFMLVCFGLSWPLNAYKSYKAGTAAGTSWQFIGLITLGYVAGIVAKFSAGQVNWVLVVYFINIACLAVNWFVYFRNVKLDQTRKNATVRLSSSEAQIGRIVIASDGSASALRATAFAAKTIRTELASSIKVITVMPDSSNAAQQRAEEALTDTTSVLDKQDIAHEEEIRIGIPAAEITTVAAQEKAGLVVVGSKGLSGLKEVMLGSVSRQVVNNVACPVLVIK